MEQSALEAIESRVTIEVGHAQDVRSAHRRRTSKGSYVREEDIRLALARLKVIMRPIRSELARLPYQLARVADQATLSDQRHRLHAASAAVQRERRKLWKMQKRTKGKNRVKRGARR